MASSVAAKPRLPVPTYMTLPMLEAGVVLISEKTMTVPAGITALPVLQARVLSMASRKAVPDHSSSRM